MPITDRLPLADRICECNHWFGEHDEGGATHHCGAPGCSCEQFRFSPFRSTPEAVIDRGGDPELWPEHVKAYVRVNARRAARAQA